MLDPNITLVLLAIVGIIVPLCTLAVKYAQDRRLAAAAAQEVKAVAIKIEEARKAHAALAKSAGHEVRAVAARVEKTRREVAATTDAKLEIIHTLVNSRLTRALDMIEELKHILTALAPDDPRVQALIEEESVI